MKKIMILFVIALVSITTAKAGGGDNNISTVIRKNLKIPNNLKKTELEEKVNVEFKISETGEATVLNVKSENKELKNYIINQFPKIDFSDGSKNTKGLYFIDINFKVL